MTIAQMIDQKLLEEQELHSKRERSGKFNPSSFGRCYRAQILNRANFPKSNPSTIRSLRIFKVGNLFHDFVQALLPEHRTEVLVETEDIYGYADIVVDAEKTVWDVKSQHSNAFWYMQNSTDITKDKETNILQVMAYVYLLNYDLGKLCFISKDDLCIAEYGFPIAQWKQRIETELTNLRAFWTLYTEAKELPPALPRAYNGNEGKYCDWQEWCVKHEKEQGRESPCAKCKR
jgi:hypothetical protein